MPRFLDSPQVPCIARVIIALAIPIIAAEYKLVDCTPKVPSVRCAHAAAMRANVNKLTKTKALWTLWAQQKSGKAWPAGRWAPMQSSKSISVSYS